MHHFNYYIPDRQWEMVQALSKQTELSVAELFRRMTDYCLKDIVLNDIVPAMSGQINVGSLR